MSLRGIKVKYLCNLWVFIVVKGIMSRNSKDIGDWPDEVMWVMGHVMAARHSELYGGIHCVGMEAYDRIRDIQRRYPEHFPWFAKYERVPKEVHEAYMMEMWGDEDFNRWVYPEFDASAAPDGGGVESHVGLGAAYQSGGPTLQDFKDFCESLNKLEEQRRAEGRRRRDVWNKHYGKYGVEFGGGIC